ncbi:ArsR/SmtB family transcription factor [Antarctobacter heliothermus]|uniref:ArsR/SmtB family transcription factor n=1 Tax=Antarctobacter heliothermus TaxID=74033 RepID=UPI000B7792C7|nr:metalloregulator ArsR/SmtB family transcription factor [Antarctobacter heliothermus]
MANHLDTLFGALSDPTRRAVIERLMSGPAPVSDLHRGHDMALTSFLKHLGKLEAAGLVRSQKRGRTRIVHIEAAPLVEVESWLARQRALWEGRLDRLTALAERMDPGKD